MFVGLAVARRVSHPYYSPQEELVRQTYVAVAGDNLFTVAQRFYGNQTTESVAKIAAASGIFDAHDVQPGQILTIP